MGSESSDPEKIYILKIIIHNVYKVPLHHGLTQLLKTFLHPAPPCGLWVQGAENSSKHHAV